MAVQENGGSMSAYGRLPTLTQFSGPKLEEISERMTRYKRERPYASKQDAINALAGGPQGLKMDRTRVGHAVDTLDQLAVVGRDGSDINGIFIHIDRNDIVPAGRAGAGTPQLKYGIDWKEGREPVKTPEVIVPIPEVQPEQPQQSLPTRLTDVRAARQARHAEQALADHEREDAKRAKAERQAVEKLVIDTGKVYGQLCIENERVKIELGTDGTATMEIWASPFQGYKPVNREDGTFIDYNWFPEPSRIDLDIFRYLTVVAQQKEGKNASYEAPKLSDAMCEATFTRAVNCDMLRIKQDPKKRAVFYYRDDADATFDPQYTTIDFVTDTVPGSLGDETIDKPLNPDFAAFLQKKKKVLDQNNKVK